MLLDLAGREGTPSFVIRNQRNLRQAPLAAGSLLHSYVLILY